MLARGIFPIVWKRTWIWLGITDHANSKYREPSNSCRAFTTACAIAVSLRKHRPAPASKLLSILRVRSCPILLRSDAVRLRRIWDAVAWISLRFETSAWRTFFWVTNRPDET